MDNIVVGTVDKLKWEANTTYNILFTYCPCCGKEIIIYTKEKK